ncbi:MAG: hypothetical protein ACE37H_00085 [Phycisphaeraceae bacterium]
MPTRPIVLRSALALAALCFALPSLAQPLIEQVPEDAALYVGWRGATDMGPDYEGSHMQGVIEQTGLLDALPQLFEAAQAFGEEMEGEELADLIGMGGTLWSTMWSNGGAMYMLPPAQGGPPIPRFAVMWNKGDNEQQLRAALSKLVQMANQNGPEDQPMAFMGNAGDAVFISIGFNANQAPAQSLKATARYGTAAKQIDDDGALVVYVDAQEWIKQVDGFVQQQKQQAEQFDRPADPFTELWPTLRDASGLSGVNRLMLSAGIKNKNWHTKLFLDAPAPRTGVLSLVDNKPIKASQLAHVPKSATYLQVFSIDPARVLEVTRDIMAVAEPNAAEQMEEGLKEVSEELGVNMERDIINGLGPVWSVYIDPMIAGNGFASMVMVNELRNPQAVEQALDKLTEKANAAMAEQLDDGPIKVRLLTQEIKGTKIGYLGVPYIAPAWMIHDGKLYVSLFPQGLEMALEHSGKAGDSILANEAFLKTTAKFGDKPYTGLSFTDLPETAADGYGINLMIVQTFAGFGEMMSGKPSSMRMPPIGKVMPYIEPAGAMTWVADDGLHMHSVEPFPGSALLGPAKGLESTMAVSGPLAIGIMLPALGAARDAAQDAQAMANARQVTVALFAYAADHDEQAPADITKLREYVGDDELFFTPNSLHAQAMPFNFDDWDQARQDKFVRKNSSFVLVPVGKLFDAENPSETIALFQRPDDIADGTIIVGWADGHVTTERDVETIGKQLKAQTGKTIDELIKAQENAGE